MRNLPQTGIFNFVLSVLLALPVHAVPLPTVTTPEARLAAEIQKMISAGHLAPGLCYVEQHYAGDVNLHAYNLDDYWHSPSELIYTLAIAIPHLPASLQSSARDYLRTEFERFPPYSYVHMGPEGAVREWVARPTEYQANWADAYDQAASAQTRAINWGPGNGEPFPWDTWMPFSAYAAWKYAQIFPAEASALLTALQPKISAIPSTLSDAYLLSHPHVLNAYIAGYTGYLSLQDLAGSTRSTQVQAWLDNARSKRIQSLSQDPALLPGMESGGFIYMTPELGDYLYQNARTQIQSLVTYQNWAAPYWAVTKAEEPTRFLTSRIFMEGYTQNIHETASQFKARAYALKWTREQLASHLDSPSVARGDLTYIQNLVAVLEAPSAQPASPCDVNANGITDVVDIQLLVLQVLQLAACTADINLDGTCNVADVQRVVVAALTGQCVSP